MPEITIDLSDLARIVNRLFELDVAARANLQILNKRAATDPRARGQHGAMFRDMKPKAVEETLPRYQPLIDAFEKQDAAAVRALLPDFARRATP